MSEWKKASGVDVSRFRIALLQMSSVEADQQANLEKAETWCREAKAKAAHFALMPEMFNCGYRQRTIWGNAYRRPRRYNLLTSRDIKDPYLRKNGYGEPFKPATR